MFSSRARLPLVVFGGALVVGMARLVALIATTSDAGGERDAAVVRVLGSTWLIAVGAALVLRVIARFARPIEDDRLRVASAVVPAIGLALILPLTVHLMFFAVRHEVQGFGDWTAIALVLTGPAHAVFATLAAFRAWRLVRGKPAMSPWAIYGLAVAAGSVPFPVLPSALIAITGLPIVPLLYLMKPVATRLAAEEPLPLAIARGA